MIKKLNLTKKEISQFKKNYSKTNIDTEVIQNVLQPFYEEKYAIIKDYCNFWWPSDKERYGLTQVMLMMVNLYGMNALRSKFGNHDFTFEGNRTYKNYLLEFDGLTIIAPSKREVVLNEEINQEIVQKLVNFENEYAQFVINYLIENHNDLTKHEQNYISEMKKLLLIDDENKINFSLTKSSSKLKIK